MLKWTRRLVPRTVGAGSDDIWIEVVAKVAAYRDRYKITSDLPVGGITKNDAQRADRRRAQIALRTAVALSSVTRRECRAVRAGIHPVLGP